MNKQAIDKEIVKAENAIQKILSRFLPM